MSSRGNKSTSTHYYDFNYGWIVQVDQSAASSSDDNAEQPTSTNFNYESSADSDGEPPRKFDIGERGKLLVTAIYKPGMLLVSDYITCLCYFRIQNRKCNILYVIRSISSNGILKFPHFHNSCGHVFHGNAC